MSSKVHGLTDLQNLKILIVSTPKTGNTWLKHLLSAVYDLPMVTPNMAFDAAEYKRFGPRWIGHQHYSPHSHVLTWARDHNVHLFTTIRHPGDVLISLYHYVRLADGHKFGPGVEWLLADTDHIGVNTLHYVERYFFAVLHGSVEWIYSKASRVIRYETLWHNPVETLAEATVQIHPVAQDVVERAVEQSDIQLLRRQHRAEGFFRQGGDRHWVDHLTPDILTAFQRQPYSAQFTALGYDLNKVDQTVSAPSSAYSSQNPFRSITHFDNGVPVPAPAIRLYLSFDTATARQRWPVVDDTRRPDSFYAWLNASANDDPRAGVVDVPLVSNMAMRLYRDRFDLVQAFPDVYGEHRIGWLLWFLRNAKQEFELDEAFIRPVWESVVNWAGQIIHEPPNGKDALPPLTRLAHHIYHKRPDVRAAYPDLNQAQRIDYILWFLQQASIEESFDAELSLPSRQLFLAWANAPDPKDTRRLPGVPAITRWAALAHQKRTEYQRLFPDLYGKHRLDYLTTFIMERTWFAEALQTLIESWAQNCVAAPSTLFSEPQHGARTKGQDD